jgi:hypothetical protein
MSIQDSSSQTITVRTKQIESLLQYLSLCIQNKDMVEIRYHADTIVPVVYKGQVIQVLVNDEVTAALLVRPENDFEELVIPWHNIASIGIKKMPPTTLAKSH